MRGDRHDKPGNAYVTPVIRSGALPSPLSPGRRGAYIYHGAGANVSDGVQYGLNVTYAVSWLRQEENQYLSCPFEIARTLPDDLLRLMGYQRGAYTLGYVDDLRDPLDALRGTHSGASGLGDLRATTERVERTR